MAKPNSNSIAAPLRAAIYGRFSHAEQIEVLSMQVQLRACREFAQRKAWAVVLEYSGEAANTFRPRE